MKRYLLFFFALTSSLSAMSWEQALVQKMPKQKQVDLTSVKFERKSLYGYHLHAQALIPSDEADVQLSVKYYQKKVLPGAISMAGMISKKYKLNSSYSFKGETGMSFGLLEDKMFFLNKFTKHPTSPLISPRPSIDVSLGLLEGNSTTLSSEINYDIFRSGLLFQATRKF